MRIASLIRLAICFLLLNVSASTHLAHAQLRVVSYNTLGNPTTASDFSNWNVVLQAIGDQSAGGIAKRIGIMALQEVDQPTGGADAQNVANLLNGLYGVSTYQASIASFGEGFNLQAFVYDSSQVQLLSTFILDIGTRPTWRGKFRPVGYSSSAAEFYVYSSHFKAFDGYQSTRASEAAQLHSSGNNLGQGANIIYAGDYNLTGGASEQAYATMLSSGNGQAIDPENGDFSDPLKKSYSSSSPVSRIDFQFITNELDDNEGLDLINGNYRVFGRVQQSPSRIITSPSQLTSASDHLPVVADYQLPAVMFAEADVAPPTLLQGEIFDLNFSVSNIAAVVAAIGADELDYTLSVIGNIGTLIGMNSGIDMALGTGNLHQLAVDTSTPGVKSGSILVTSNSPGVENGSLSLNLMFEVLAAGLAGDYNGDGTIDAADYTVWRDVVASNGSLLNDPTPEVVDQSDYDFWRAHFGESFASGSGSHEAGATVPEPSALVTLLVGMAGIIPFRWRRIWRQNTRWPIDSGIVLGALIGALPAHSAHAVGLRVATFNSSLSPIASTGEKSLAEVLESDSEARGQRIAEIIQRINPDILLINEFNWDAEGRAADFFARNYLSVGHDAAGTGTPSTPISYPYRYLPTGASSPFNTGIPSGKDFNNDGTTTGPDDAFGFGEFPGRYGMVVFSKFPIKTEKVRTFQRFFWHDMPDNLIPTPFYSPDEVEILRLSSKSHWDIPIDFHGQTIHVLASHPTPPVFDGAEDRNGQRNFDEIRFWRDYITSGAGDYIYDDHEFAAAGSKTPEHPAGGLPAGATFVILGDQNADPVDGESRPGAIQQLLGCPRVNVAKIPIGAGGPQAAKLSGGHNLSHLGDPAYDTAAFGRSGNLRADYVLPSSDVKVVDARVFWFVDSEALFPLVSHSNFPSDHRAVYVDVEIPTGGTRGDNNTIDSAR